MAKLEVSIGIITYNFASTHSNDQGFSQSKDEGSPATRDRNEHSADMQQLGWGSADALLLLTYVRTCRLATTGQPRSPPHTRSSSHFHLDLLYSPTLRCLDL